MNILHVLSQHEVTGAETHAATLIARQAAAGHGVAVVSDTLSTPVDAAYVPMPIGRRGYVSRIRNVLALRRLVRARGIHVVHAHSRAASWVAYFATRGTDAVLVSTLHALQTPHPSARAFSVYGEQAIAVSHSVEENALRDLGLRRSRVKVVPNGVDLERFHPAASSAEARRALGLPERAPIVALVGRLSGPRAAVAKLVVTDVFVRVREAVPDAQLMIVGGMKLPDELGQLLAAADRHLAGGVRHLGHLGDVVPALAAADVVVAAGRSAIEALAVGRPVVALGETHYVGVVGDETEAEALRTNFGDTGRRAPSDAAGVAAAVSGLLQDPGLRRELGEWGRAFAERHFDAAKTWPRVEAVYRQARALKARPRIPVVTYHRVVEREEEGGRHGIWVTAARLSRQLDSLARRRMTPVTFRDVAAFLAGEKALPRRPVILTFDDGYADNHALALPLLRERGMAATIFLVGDARIVTNAWDAEEGEPQVQLLTREEVREMAAQGIEFGSHSRSHARLVGLDPDRLRVELAGSKRALEERIGAPVTVVCYPYGAVDDAVKEAALEAGYWFGVASDSGPLRFGDDLLEIRRAQVFPGTGGFGFWKKTSRWYLSYRAVIDRLGVGRRA